MKNTSTVSVNKVNLVIDTSLPACSEQSTNNNNNNNNNNNKAKDSKDTNQKAYCILIISDNFYGTRYGDEFISWLAAKGCSIVVAVNSTIALNILKTEQVDVVFCDIHMKTHQNIHVLAEYYRWKADFKSHMDHHIYNDFLVFGISTKISTIERPQALEEVFEEGGIHYFVEDIWDDINMIFWVLLERRDYSCVDNMIMALDEDIRMRKYHNRIGRKSKYSPYYRSSEDSTSNTEVDSDNSNNDEESKSIESKSRTKSFRWVKKTSSTTSSSSSSSAASSSSTDSLFARIRTYLTPKKSFRKASPSRQRVTPSQQ